MAETAIQLTEDQKNKIREIFASSSETPGVIDVTRRVFNNPELDGRDREGRAVKDFLEKEGLSFLVRTASKNAKGLAELTDAQKAFIENHKDNMSFLEIARELFGKPALTNLHQEARSVLAYIRELSTKIAAKPDKDVDALLADTYVPSDSGVYVKNEYKSPQTVPQTVARINKYLNLGWKDYQLKKRELNSVESLKRYMNVFRFSNQMNSYVRQSDRDSFEDAFVRYVYDKPDLLQEELDQYITLCAEVVIAADIRERVQELGNMLRNNSNNSDGTKIAQGLNDAINNLQTDYNQCIGRQRKLYDALIQSRSKRIEATISENASMVNLVLAWKDEEKRKQMLQYAELERKSLEGEVKRLEGIPFMQAMIRGLSVEEAVHG